jgi:DNA-directed RNA polymerase subunit RPC12/RpoP
MRKITIEVVLLEPAEALDLNQKDRLAPLSNAGVEVEGRGAQMVYVRCPYCGYITQINLSDLEEGTRLICPNCGGGAAPIDW